MHYAFYDGESNLPITLQLVSVNLCKNFVNALNQVYVPVIL